MNGDDWHSQNALELRPLSERAFSARTETEPSPLPGTEAKALVGAVGNLLQIIELAAGAHAINVTFAQLRETLVFRELHARVAAYQNKEAARG